MLQRVYGTAWATQERARPVPVAARGGEEARPSPARRPARPVQLPRRLAGLGVLASEGPAHLAHARGGDARAPASGAATRRSARRSWSSERLWQQSGHWDLYRDNMFLDRVRGPDLQPQADELPGEHVHLPLAPALVSRPAAALQRVRPAASQRAVGDAQRPDPGAPVHPGRRAPVRPPGPADRRDRGAARRGARGVWLVRSRAALRVRDQAGQGARRPGAVGAGRAAHP